MPKAAPGSSTGVRLFRFASTEERPVLVDLAPDGRVFAFFVRDELRVYDLTKETMRVVGRARPARAEPDAMFSPDGRRLLYRHGEELRATELSSGRSIRVATAASGPSFWLRDGRVAYRARDGRLMFVRPGKRPRRTELELHDGRFALASDARRLLYDDHCETFLADLATGRRRRLSGQLFVNPGTWAPDGSSFVLQWAESCEPRTGSVSAYHTHNELFEARGRRIAVFPGAGATWSRDSRWLLGYPHPTGSATSGLGSVLAVDMIARTESTLIRVGNAYSEAFVGPGGWIVFSRYDRPGSGAYGGTSGQVYLARIVGPRRR